MVESAQEMYRENCAWLNAVIFNSQGPEKPFQIEDFLPKEEKELTVDEIVAAQQKELDKWHVWMNNCKKGT